MIKDKFVILKPHEGSQIVRKLPIQDVSEMLMANMNPKDYATALADYFEAKIATAMRVNALVAQIIIDPNDVDNDEYELFKYNLVNLYQEDDKVIVMPLILFREYASQSMIDDQININDKTVSASSTLVNNKINASALHVRVASLRMVGLDNLNYTDIATKIKDQLGEYSNTVQEEIDKYATIISDKSNDALAKLRTITTDIIGDNNEPAIVEYDAFAEVDYGSYSGTGTSHVIENMTLGQTIASGAVTAGKVVVGLFKGVGKLLGKLGKYAVKTFDKYVMPAVVSKDFVKGEGTDEYHIDYPMKFTRDTRISSVNYRDILANVKTMIARTTENVGSVEVKSYAKYDGLHIHAGYSINSNYNNEHIACDMTIYLGGNFYIEEIGYDDNPMVEGNNYLILNQGYARFLLIGNVSSLNTTLGESYYVGPSKEDPEEKAIYIMDYDEGVYKYAGLTYLGEPTKLNFRLVYPEVADSDYGYNYVQNPQNDSDIEKFQLDDPLIVHYNNTSYKFGTLFCLRDKDNIITFTPNHEVKSVVVLAPMALDLDSMQTPAEVGVTVLSTTIPRQSVYVDGVEFNDNWWGPNDTCMLIQFDMTSDYYDRFESTNCDTWLNIPCTFVAQYLSYKPVHSATFNNSINMEPVAVSDYDIKSLGICSLGEINKQECLVHKLMNPIKYVLKPVEFDDKTLMYDFRNERRSWYKLASDDYSIPIHNWNSVSSNTDWVEGITMNHCNANPDSPMSLITLYMRKFVFGSSTVDSDIYQLKECIEPGVKFSPLNEHGYLKYDSYFIIGYIPGNCIYQKESQVLDDLWNQHIRSYGVRSVFVNQRYLTGDWSDEYNIKLYVDCDQSLINDDDITQDLICKSNYDLYMTTRGIDNDLNDDLAAAVQDEYYKVVNNDLPIIFRSQLYSMQYKLKNGTIDCIEFIAPSDPKGFIYESDGKYHSAFTLSGTKVIFCNPTLSTETGSKLEFDLSSTIQVANLRDKLLELFDQCDNNTYVKEFDGETGDINAFIGIKASLLKMNLIMLCMSGDKTPMFNYLMNGSEFEKPDNVANGDFIKAIKYCSFNPYKATSRINSFYESLIPILVTSMIYNKQSVLPFVYSATFDYGIFIPYGEQARLGLAKWHIRDDEEVAQAAAKIWDVIIASVIVIALAVIIGIGIWKFKDKMKFKVSQLQAKERQNSLKQNDLVKQRDGLNDSLTKHKKRVKELKAKGKAMTPEEAKELVTTQSKINTVKKNLAKVSDEFKKTWGVTKSNNLKLWFIKAVSGVSVPSAAVAIKDNVKSKITESNESVNSAIQECDNTDLEINAKLDLILSKL